jgi:signal transduction histidine kinase
MTLTRKLLASYLAIAAVAGGVLVLAADRALRHRLTAEARLELEREAQLLTAVAAGADRGGLDSLVHRLGGETGRRLTVINRRGVVIADSDFPADQLGTLENHATRPEFAAALGGHTGSDLRRSVSTGHWELKVAVPYRDGAVRVSSPLPQVDALVRRAQGAVLLGAGVALAVGILLAAGFSAGVARPLVQLRDAAQAIARGEHPPIDARGRDEVGDLARALRTVDENLTTRLAELEHERAETAALIGSMVEAVIACDARGEVVTVNPAARELFGLAEAAVIPPVRELFRQRAALEAVEAALAGRTATAVEVALDRRTVLLSGRALAGGGAVFVLHDVTDLKRLENVRRDFVANVSHELKTPLTVVRGYAETLLKDEPAPDVRRGFLETMLANARRMQQLIDDLLDLSRIESGAWRPEPAEVALEPLVAEVWAALRERAEAAGLTFRTAVAPEAATVRADPEALRQVLSNLLDNAVHYTGAGGSIEVRAARDAAAVRIEVADTGVGIPGEHLPRIFERFYRVDPARSRELGGTGLGLAIVKHVVEAHGGRALAESRLGAGTTIRIEFPAS